MIDVKNLSKSFGDHLVLDDISAHISPGEKVVVIGPSGSGKSTFLRCLNLLETPTKGSITFQGTEITDPKADINKIRQQMGMVFQHFNLFPNMTIRKDIKILESKGLLYKVHGSARPANPHVADLDVHVKDNINRDAKRRIAQRAAEMLGETDSIIVASGSTVYAFAEEIKMRMWHHLNIVTPFLRLGVLLNESENVNVVQLGGSVHKKSLSVLGEEAARELDDCICSKVFFGVDGIDPEHGITTSTIDEAKLTRRMMHAASQVIVLADSSKFGQRGFGRICALEDIDVIVTDERIPEQMISIIEEAGVDLIIVR